MDTYNEQDFYKAHLARDPRFDGKFFVAVKSTGIYCRPICPARKAQLKNLTFYLYAAQAEEADFRPCMRCRPETAPGSAAWLGTSATVQRAIRLMDHFAVDGLTIAQIAEKLGVGERWLRELFQQQVGASPIAVLNARKLDIARNLLDNSALPITEIALNSGFQSIRRFNDAFKKRFKQSPRDLRKNADPTGNNQIHLSYRPPYHWQSLIDFFANRTITGVEQVSENSYERLIQLNGVDGWMRVSNLDNNQLQIEFKFNGKTNLIDFVSRLKALFDLDADPMSIERTLREDPQLETYLKKLTGLRIPGTWDSFESACRAIIGQLISVKAARTILGKLVQRCGKQQTIDANLLLTHFFPTPQELLSSDLNGLSLPASKINSLKAVAQALTDGTLALDGTADEAETRQKLLAIKGIGKWTADNITMRSLKNPDVIPDTDLMIKKRIEELNLNPENWKPWRAYGAALLWNLK